MDRLFRTAQTNIAEENYSETAVTESPDWLIAVEKAEYIENHVLHLSFSDGQEKLVDFGPFLRQSLNPLIRKYLDIERFKQFTVEYGDLFWNDYDLCFPVADLYEGHIGSET